MGYLHIDNLRTNGKILFFKQVYCMEKVHGSSAHISWKEGKLNLFCGGIAHELFLKCFNQEELIKKFQESNYGDIVIYGEGYGGKMQKMSATYGPELKFIAFDVWHNEKWMNVEQAHRVCDSLGIEFVPYKIVPTDREILDAERDKPSEVAERRGCGVKLREGVVLRPLFECTDSNGNRVIAKHKGDAFAETISHKRERTAAEQAILDEAAKIEKGSIEEVQKKAELMAKNWVTPMRLQHVMAAFVTKHQEKTGEIIELTMAHTRGIIDLMVEDVLRESAGEVADTKLNRSTIIKECAALYKKTILG